MLKRLALQCDFEVLSLKQQAQFMEIEPCVPISSLVKLASY